MFMLSRPPHIIRERQLQSTSNQCGVAYDRVIAKEGIHALTCL